MVRASSLTQTHGTLIVLVIVPVRPPPSVTLRVMVLEPPVANVKVITLLLPMMAPLGRVHWKDTIPTSSVELLASNVQLWLVLQAAVNLATNWAYLGPLTNVSLVQTNLNSPIPDGNSNGVTRFFTFTNVNFRVEQVTLTLTAPHVYWGDLAVTLTSPGGVQSRLAELHYPVDTYYCYDAWAFSSVRHWGEKANGVWSVKVADLYAGYTGNLLALDLTLYGTTPTAALTVAKTNQSIRLNLQAAAPAWTYAIEYSTNLNAWSSLTNLIIPTTGRTNLLDANALLQNRRFYRARLLP